MAVTHNFFLTCFLLFLLPCIAKLSFKPKALILPVTKDPSTLQHITYITHKNPLKPIKLSVDLGGHSLWVDCESSYNTSTYKWVNCKTTQCTLVKYSCGDGCEQDNMPTCTKDQCYNSIYAPYIDEIYPIGKVAEDVILIQSTDGKKLGQVATIKGFIFTCANNYFIPTLPRGMIGMAGLGSSDIGLPTQLAKIFNFPRKFGVCLSSSTKAKGFIILGDGPYITLPNIDISKNLVYTPLLTNPLGNGHIEPNIRPSPEYFIGVKSIKIGTKTLKLNTTLLSTNREGRGGTKITNTSPYTLLESSIYKVVTQEFIKQVPNARRVAAVKPLQVCFSSKKIGSTPVGPAVPVVDLVLRNDVVWRLAGTNLMVQVNKDVMCLGIVERGHVDEQFHTATSIIIGAHQIEDNLLQFDLVQNKVGFSSSLLAQRTTCGSFNFASHTTRKLSNSDGKFWYQ